jgi:DNA-binding response OmpR family regulator
VRRQYHLPACRTWHLTFVFLLATVTSSKDNRETVVRCLSQGAADYWIKPLRSNEVRNLWTRVWWRKSGPGVERMEPEGELLGETSGDSSDNTRK